LDPSVIILAAEHAPSIPTGEGGGMGDTYRDFCTITTPLSMIYSVGSTVWFTVLHRFVGAIATSVPIITPVVVGGVGVPSSSPTAIRTWDDG